MLNQNEWNSPGTFPNISGEYQAALEPMDAADTVRRYFNGRTWSKPYHIFWNDTLKNKCQNESCDFMPYWKNVS